MADVDIMRSAILHLLSISVQSDLSWTDQVFAVEKKRPCWPSILSALDLSCSKTRLSDLGLQKLFWRWWIECNVMRWNHNNSLLDRAIKLWKNLLCEHVSQKLWHLHIQEKYLPTPNSSVSFFFINQHGALHLPCRDYLGLRNKKKREENFLL